MADGHSRAVFDLDCLRVEAVRVDTHGSVVGDLVGEDVVHPDGRLTIWVGRRGCGEDAVPYIEGRLRRVGRGVPAREEVGVDGVGLEGSVGVGGGHPKAQWGLEVKGWVGGCGRVDGVVG